MDGGEEEGGDGVAPLSVHAKPSESLIFSTPPLLSVSSRLREVLSPSFTFGLLRMCEYTSSRGLICTFDSSLDVFMLSESSSLYVWMMVRLFDFLIVVRIVSRLSVIVTLNDDILAHTNPFVCM